MQCPWTQNGPIAGAGGEPGGVFLPVDSTHITRTRFRHGLSAAGVAGVRWQGLLRCCHLCKFFSWASMPSVAAILHFNTNGYSWRCRLPMPVLLDACCSMAALGLAKPKCFCGLVWQSLLCLPSTGRLRETCCLLLLRSRTVDAGGTSDVLSMDAIADGWFQRRSVDRRASSTLVPS